MGDRQNRNFRLSIADDKARKMTRKQYYAARSYLRGVERKIAEALGFNAAKNGGE